MARDYGTDWLEKQSCSGLLAQDQTENFVDVGYPKSRTGGNVSCMVTDRTTMRQTTGHRQEKGCWRRDAGD